VEPGARGLSAVHISGKHFRGEAFRPESVCCFPVETALPPPPGPVLLRPSDPNSHSEWDCYPKRQPTDDLPPEFWFHDDTHLHRWVADAARLWWPSKNNVFTCKGSMVRIMTGSEVLQNPEMKKFITHNAGTGFLTMIRILLFLTQMSSLSPPSSSLLQVGRDHSAASQLHRN
jgi:hypothetical protein